MLVPLTELRSAIEMLDRELELYPIWLCPFKLFAQVRGKVWYYRRYLRCSRGECWGLRQTEMRCMSISDSTVFHRENSLTWRKRWGNWRILSGTLGGFKWCTLTPTWPGKNSEICLTTHCTTGNVSFSSEKMEMLSSRRLTSCLRVREKVGCRGNFPEVYDKVNRKARAGINSKN